MKNMFLYYYHIYPDTLYIKDDNYFLKYKNNNYMFALFNRPESDALALYNLNSKILKRDVLVHKIIMNSNGNVLSYIDNKPYVLLEIFINSNSLVTLPDICNINNKTINIECDKQITRYNWDKLWEMKNDYFELQINEIGSKFPNLSKYINYYLGLAENAISYVKNAIKIKGDVYYSVSHRRIDYNSNLLMLYNPLDYVYDYRIRDACEYIKNAFFNGKDALDLVDVFFKNNFLTYKEAVLFYGRLLYPSYFFDLQDEIVNKNLDEKALEKIICKSKEYEFFLKKVHEYISKIYDTYIPAIDWLI